MDRRTATMLIGAAAIAPQYFAAAAAEPKPVPHDERAAKAEFAKIIALINAGDLAAFLAYRPLGIMVDGKKLESDRIPGFLEQMTSNNEQKDGAPIAIDSFSRMKKVVTRAVYTATLERSAYFPEQCEVDYCMPGGHSPMYEFWRVFFDGPRIVLLEQLTVIA
jgi:hypothetical protein